MFKVAGVSRCNGVFKVRFAGSMDRVKILVKTGHDEIELMELPEAMDKPAVVTYLKGTKLMERAEYRAAIEAADAKYNDGKAATPVKAPRAAKTVKVAGVKVKVKAAKPAAAPEAAPAAPADTTDAADAGKATGNWFEEKFAAEIAADQAAAQE